MRSWGALFCSDSLWSTRVTGAPSRSPRPPPLRQRRATPRKRSGGHQGGLERPQVNSQRQRHTEERLHVLRRRRLQDVPDAALLRERERALCLALGADLPTGETIHLRLNYRCGSQIVTTSQYALGADRGYRVPDGAAQGTVYFHARPGNFEHQAEHLFADVLPAALVRTDVRRGHVAILYQAAWIGDAVEEAARRHGFEMIRADRNALYPRSSRLLRWLELCAVWCCGGWRGGKPRFGTLAGDGWRLFAEALISEDNRVAFNRALIFALWRSREPDRTVHEWLAGLRGALLDCHLARCRSLDEESAMLDRFMERTGAGR